MLQMAAAAFLTVVLACFAHPASAGTWDPVALPDLVSFSDGTGSVRCTGHEITADYEIYRYQCNTGDVEAVVQEYIRILKKAGLHIRQSEKTVYDEASNDANYGIAFGDVDRDRAKFKVNDPDHGWLFNDVSVYISFSTGGNYSDQYVCISCAKGSYKISGTGEKMRKDRGFSAADWYYYRNQLKTDEMKEAYDYLLPKLEEMQSPISLAGLPFHMNDDDFFLVWYAVLVDNPQIFTTDDTRRYNMQYYGDGTLRSFSVQYFYNKKDLSAMKKEYEQAVAEALKVIDPYMTDLQKERALHDWLCRRIQYDYNISEGTTGSYSAIVKGSAVCEGYSEAFTELLHRAGIEAATVYGTAKVDAPNNTHAWNFVRIDGEWRYVDVTWDDETDPVRYDYFNLTEEEIARDHTSGIGEFPP